MTQLQQIEKVLRRNTSRGVTPEKLSELVNIPVPNLYKRVSELRETVNIERNVKMVNGERKLFYRIAS